MADTTVPYFRNDPGVKQIEIGAREFMCTGASAPYDHPHIFLDMGDDHEIICPYCSTHYKFNGQLGASQANPEACAYAQGETV